MTRQEYIQLKIQFRAAKRFKAIVHLKSPSRHVSKRHNVLQRNKRAWKFDLV